MSVDIGTLHGTISLEDQFSTALNDMAGKVSKQMQAVGQAFSQVGQSLTLGVTTPLVAAAGASVMFSGEFEASLTRISSLAGATVPELQGIKEHILALAPTVGIGAQPLVEAMMKISSTTNDTAVALDILDMSARASAAGMGKPEAVAGALTAIINSYGKENITAARAVDVLTKAVQDGGAEASELAPTLANVVPIAAQMGISFEEVAANLATVTKLGVPTAQAVTSITSVMSAMTRETAQGVKALASVGMTYAMLRDEVQNKGLASALLHLKETFEGNDNALMDVLGRIEAYKNIMAVTGAQAEIYTEEVKRMTAAGKEGTAAQDAFNAMGGKQTQTWNQLTAALSVTAVKLGDALAPALMSVMQAAKPLLEAVSGLVTWFGELPAPVQTTALAFLALVAAAGPVLMIVGTVLTSIGLIVPLFAAGTTGAALLAGAWGLLTAPITAASFGLGSYTTASGLASIATVGFTGVVKALWAVMKAHPFIALLSGLALVTAAVVTYMAKSAEAGLRSEELAAQQMTINEALRLGAKAGIGYGDAIEYIRVTNERLHNPMTVIRDTLKEMGDNGNVAAEKMYFVNKAVISMGEAGTLGKDQMDEFRKIIEALNLPLDELTPALRNIIVSFQNMEKVTPPLSTAVQELVNKIGGSEAMLAGTQWMEAVEKIGGVTKLTTKDQAELNSILTATIEAYKLLGKEVPLAMQQMVASVSSKEVTSLVEKLGGKDALIASEQWMEALRKIGGLSKMSTEDQGAMNTVLKEAVAVYKRLGVEAPAALTETLNATLKYSDAYASGWDSVKGKSKEALQEIADVAKATYDRMQFGTQTFTREALQEQLEKVRETSAAARGLGTALVEAQQAAQAETDKQNKLLDEQRIKAEQAARAMGGSFEVNKSNFESVAKSQGLNSGDIEALLKKGYSYQQAVLWSQHPDWAPPSSPGPAVPGFGAANDPTSNAPNITAPYVAPPAPQEKIKAKSRSGGVSDMSHATGAHYDDLPGGGREWITPPAASGGVTLQPGAIQINYPIMKDRAALNQLGILLGEALDQKLRGKGFRMPVLG